MQYGDEDTHGGDEEMDTTPNHATTAAPKKTERKPPGVETTKQRGQVDKANPGNGQKPVQLPINPTRREGGGRKKGLIQCGSWNIRRRVWKQDI